MQTEREIAPPHSITTVRRCEFTPILQHLTVERYSGEGRPAGFADLARVGRPDRRRWFVDAR
jgi:hypothetical protein